MYFRARIWRNPPLGQWIFLDCAVFSVEASRLKGGLSAENEQNRDSESREQKEQARRAFKRWESVCDGPVPSFYAQAIEDDWCLRAEL